MPLLQAILDLFFPPCCPFCSKILAAKWAGEAKASSVEKGFVLELPGVVCACCMAELPWLKDCCPRCARPLSPQVRDCPHCREYPPAFDNCCALGSYEGALRETLHRFKYRGAKGLAVPLGRLLAARLSDMTWISSVEMLVPVPLYPSRQRERGYNQAVLLAGTVGRELGIPVKAILERTRNTKSQTGQNRKGRWENMQGAFCCSKQPADRGESQGKKHLLLVDDILTSGATAHAACQTLRQDGWESVSLAVIAR